MVGLEEPDKGRAWVIAMAACIINMILSGLSRMIGILYVSVIDTYDVSRQDATLPFTVRNGIRMLSGPLVGILGQRYGIRTVTFLGGVVAAAGAGLCYIAPDIIWLTFFWGGMHGLGFALANTLFQVVVNQYFQKYRATASGIALSGACLGSLGFPFMIEGILESFGLSGSFLILAGIIMHVLPFSLLLTSPQWVKYPAAYARLWALQNGSMSAETVESVAGDDGIDDDDDELMESSFARTTSFSNDPCESVEVSKASIEEGSLFPASCRGRLRTASDDNVVCTRFKKRDSSPKWRHSENGHVDLDTISEVYSISKQMEANEVEAPNPSPVKPQNANTQSVSQSLKSIAKLYTNPVYVLISFCMSTYVIIFIPILTVLVDYGTDKGLPVWSGKYLINAMAIGDLVGRLCFGWVTDRKFMTIPNFMTLVLVLEGLFIGLFPLANSLGSFIALLVLYGMMAGSILVLFPVLVLQYVDHHEQSVAIACVGMLSGVMSFAMPAMIGHFRDVVGSYDGMFYLTGGLSVVSGGLWLLEPVVYKYHYGEKFHRKVNDTTKKESKS